LQATTHKPPRLSLALARLHGGGHKGSFSLDAGQAEME
jgi:hypothetical protein